MATIRTPTKTWVAREAEVIIARAHQVVIGAATTLSGSFATSGVKIEAAAKNVTITPPETAWEKVDFLGQDTNSFQNQLLDEKPVGMATFTGTVLLGEDEVIEDYVVSGTVTGIAGYTRYQVGKNNTNEIAICVNITDPLVTKLKTVVLDNARVTKWGDVKESGADAHWEQDLTIICLAKDFYYEVKK